MIYLDNAATTLIKPKKVACAMSNAVSTLASPGRGGHRFSMAAADTAYKCREAAADLFNVPEPENIIFTINATHALNIAIKSLAKKGSNVVISGYEHNSVLRPLYSLGAKIDIAKSKLFDIQGTIEEFKKRISNDTDLVVCTHMSNVFGFILPIKEISEICKHYSVPLIIDASQSAGTINIDLSAIGADFIAMPGHKGLLGPQGTGILIANSTAKSLLEGGTGSNSILPSMPDFLPDMLEAGTHNMPGIAGLLEGLRFIKKIGTDKILLHERNLLKTASSGLMRLKNVIVYSSNIIENQGGVLSFNIPGISSEDTAKFLADNGIAVRAGLHCAPLAHESANTINIGTVRISFSPFNTLGDVRYFLGTIKNIQQVVDCNI